MRELRLFRELRDECVKNIENGEELIETYYQTAPKIIERLTTEPDGVKEFIVLYRTVQEISNLIEKKEYDRAFKSSIAEFFKLLRKCNFYHELEGLREFERKRLV